jgi:uncharacterized peroxidase-related enzyme
MTRIATVAADQATGRAKELLDATQKQLGRIPNLYGSMAQSPAALDSYLAMRGALVKGVLNTKMKERIALLTAAVNDCNYCVAAHTFRGGKIGMTPEDLEATQKAQSSDPKDAAALRFVEALVQHNGKLPAAAFNEVRSAGWTDEEIGEIVAHVALNVFSNYFNHVAEPELDFPAVALVR